MVVGDNSDAARWLIMLREALGDELYVKHNFHKTLGLPSRPASLFGLHGGANDSSRPLIEVFLPPVRNFGR
jgi:hypothetical protein